MSHPITILLELYTRPFAKASGLLYIIEKMKKHLDCFIYYFKFSSKS